MTELAAAYNAIKAGRAGPDLEPLPIQYPDFSAWQRARLDGGELEAQREYWRQQLAGSPQLLELPTDFARPPVPSGRGGLVEFTLPAPLTQRLRYLAASTHATMFMVMVAAWQVVALDSRTRLDRVWACMAASERRAVCRCCWAATAAQTTSWLALRWATGRTPSWRASSATLSTRRRSAQALQVA